MKGKKRGLAASAILLTSLAGCDWFTDFKRQPSVETWESTRADSALVRGNPAGSVPITGNRVPAFAVSYSPTPATIDSMASLGNPRQPNDSSIANGHKYYQINCAVCHGDKGDGAGPATTYGMIPIPLLTPITVGRTDGYLYGMIRNGRGSMPSYNRIEDLDRWDVVNYVRGLQGRLGRPVPTGPVGAPGETGAKLPGATELGPTRPVPHTVSRQSLAPDSAAAPPAPAADTAGVGARPERRP